MTDDKPASQEGDLEALVRNLYSAASNGFHVSQTNGLDKVYHHVSKFRNMENLHHYEDAWLNLMRYARDSFVSGTEKSTNQENINGT